MSQMTRGGLFADNLPVPLERDNVELVDGTAVTYTVPSYCDFVLIYPVDQATGLVTPVWYATGTAAAPPTAVIPTTTVTDGSAAGIIGGPATFRVWWGVNGLVLSFIRVAAVTVNVSISRWMGAQR